MRRSQNKGTHSRRLGGLQRRSSDFTPTSRTAMSKTIPEELWRLLSSLKGLECWYVSCGGAAGSTFQLSLGEKVRRSVQLKNPAHSEEFRQFEGEAAIFVWCAWRLDALDG